jgi:uncharacterized membrane-anchored protein
MANFSASTTLFSLIDSVPLSECKIPTLIVSPLAAVVGEAAGDVAGLSVGLGELFAQALSKMVLPIVAEV